MTVINIVIIHEICCLKFLYLKLMTNIDMLGTVKNTGENVCFFV